VLTARVWRVSQRGLLGDGGSMIGPSKSERSHRRGGMFDPPDKHAIRLARE
jgi:hypothetical protein